MPTRQPSTSPFVVAATIALLVAGCGGAADASATGELASPLPTATGLATDAPGPTASPVPSLEPTATATATPTESAEDGVVPPDAFWATVRRGLDDAGHLVVTADGSAPVVVRYVPEASEALVGGDLVSRCVGTRSWAGDSGSLAPVPGVWRCGADALVAGFRATAAPIDSWSPDFPAEGSPEERVETGADGTWTWTYEVADGLEGKLEASLSLDQATGRLLAGSRTDETGTTTWTFDYATPVEGITPP